MAAPLQSSLPYPADLPAGYQVVLTALDATTGAAVTGVTISSWAILVDQLTEGDLIGANSAFKLVAGPSA